MISGRLTTTLDALSLIDMWQAGGPLSGSPGLARAAPVFTAGAAAGLDQPTTPGPDIIIATARAPNRA